MKMKKSFFKAIAITALTCVGCLTAGAQILWKVEKEGCDKVSYILGTHHFATLATVDGLPGLADIFNNIDKLYGEMDMQAMTDPSVMMGMQQMMMAPADSTIDKLLKPEQLDSLRGYWDSLTGGQIPLDMLYGMKPATLSAQIAALVSAKTFPDLNPMQGIDMTMQQRAREAGKPVLGFETMEFQLDLLYGRPLIEQADALMSAVRETESEAKMIKLSEAYKNHDIDTILSVMQEEDGNDPEALDRILYSRNADWIRQLKTILPESSVLVVVGAGHLPGEKGVLEGLRGEGFTVTPVK